MRRATVAELCAGDIVRFQGEWGVIKKTGSGRVLDRWQGPPIVLYPHEMVEILEKRVKEIKKK